MKMPEPIFSYPWPDAINPYADWIQIQTERWLFQNYPSLPARIKEKYKHTATGYLTARFFPFASKERLLPLAMSSLWGLAFDDYYEHADASTLQGISNKMADIITGRYTPKESDNEYYHEMDVMAKAFRQFMPDYWMNRFARSMTEYFLGMELEAPFKKNLTFPTADQYLSMRWRSVDVLQMCDGLEVATGLPLPDDIRHHPHMEKIVFHTCRIIALANDYFSAQKEKDRDVMNMVLICQHQLNLSFEEAVVEMVNIHNQEVSIYLDLCDTLPSTIKDQPGVQEYLLCNNYMIAGHWRWYFTDTKRYLPGGHPTDEFK